MVRVFAISGSLRAASANTAVIRAAARLAPDMMEIVVYDDLGLLPPFNPDLDTDDPPSLVAALRSAVGACDGLLVSVPEYAHALPGAFKNALDWLVGSLTFPGKPIAIFSTTRRAVHAPAQLREVFATMDGRIVEAASVTLSLQGVMLDEQGFLSDPGLSRAIRDALTTFARVIAPSAERRMPCA